MKFKQLRKEDRRLYYSKMAEEYTVRFIEYAFRIGEIKTTGTDIDKILPPVSRFGGGNRSEKKERVIERLKAYFEKFHIIGESFKADNGYENAADSDIGGIDTDEE